MKARDLVEGYTTNSGTARSGVRALPTEWRHVRLTRLYRLLGRGWEWWADPRRGMRPMLRSRSGVVFEFRAVRGGVLLRPSGYGATSPGRTRED